ncbi:LysM peptidoglycan-binding domain-containing protein [Prosthecobacter sp.]|uniref:LysM peptidoglycan-binding domain-containing protein n=1 Tax=Prosthecobacter sp. TaxID=1965333 RepID=UPI002ABB6462|nr:LysM peptidoglycan-binding domain-containing protein [Prosthecobacter sp.]MDZ4402985.1 LysM peptidoglycan-binding domain-containing protein [Prosthecobacter sp.]
MKTLPASSRVLSYLVAFWGTALPLSAQVSYNYTAPPPPGYPAAGAPKQTSRTTRQSAAAVQAPATYPSYPGTYPPPPGYTYPPPPGYGTAPRTAISKPAATKPSTKTSSSSKKSTAGPPPPPKVYGPTGDLSSQVAKLRDSDKVQNLRLGDLERDVSSIKRGGKSSSGSRYAGGTDLAAHTTYIARPGDTLWRIASTHRVSVGEIQQLNRMTEEEVHVGQTLLIPSPHRLSSPTTQVSYKPSTPGSSPAPVSTSAYYTVKKNDSLKGIAIKHKMTTVTLASANNIKDVNKIFVGQRLKIPGRTSSVASSKSTPPPQPESSDTVPLPGFGVPSAPPPPASGLAPATAPTPAPSPAAPAKPDASTADSHRGILAYRVDRSDTIESIATQFSTTPDRIREINRLSTSTPLKSGDEIMVPAMGAVSVGR